MKKNKDSKAGAAFILVLLCLTVLSGCVPVCRSDEGSRTEERSGIGMSGAKDNGYTALNYENMKAMWLTQYDMRVIYTDGNDQRSERDFSRRAQQVMDNILSVGINTVFIQVRPFGDSIYPSEYYPPSEYAVGRYGKGFDYDPFGILLTEAHRRGISVHAWINPLRCMSVEKSELLDGTWKIRQWSRSEEFSGKYIVNVDGTWYLNPTYAQVRGLIADGVREIVEKYDVDGIHMDDYFYPTVSPAFDSEAYSEYIAQDGRGDLQEYRRGEVNRLVRELYGTVKSVRADVMFGIAPAGNIDTDYNILCADVYEWCSKEGYIDYLCPEIYYGFEHGSVPFTEVCTAFSEIIKCDSVRLIIGMSLGKAAAADAGEKDVWAGSGALEWVEYDDILFRQLQYTKLIGNCSGAAYFSYRFFFDPDSGKPADAALAERERLIPYLRQISWQSDA